MEINRNCNQPAFGMKFINNKAFNEVVKHAQETKQLHTLDSALNALLKANDGDAFITHGTNSNGLSFSNITLGRKSVQNSTLNKKPAEASFDGLIELSSFGRKFRQLVNGDLKSNIKPEDIISSYTV